MERKKAKVERGEKMKLYLLIEQDFGDPPSYKLVNKEMWDWINKEEEFKSVFGKAIALSEVKVDIPEWLNELRRSKGDSVEEYIECGGGKLEIMYNKASYCPSLVHNGRDLYFFSVIELQKYINSEEIEIVEEMNVDGDY